MGKKTILHLLSTNSFGGAENVVCQISDMFRADEFFDIIYCSPDGPIRETLRKWSVEYFPLKKLTATELYRAIKTIKPDLIHAHDMKASVLAAIVNRKIPLISHIHNNSIESRRLTMKTVAYCFAAWKAKQVFWVSRSARAEYYFSHLFSLKSSVLPNIVNSDLIRSQAAKAENIATYDVVYVGGLRYPKNPQRLITVLERSIQECPSLQAAIIGTGDLANEIRNLITEKKLEENIHLWGFQSNPYGIMSHSKSLLLTSRWEGMPLCILEAMVLGVPVVSTRATGVCDIVTDGENGFLSDDDGQLASCIVRLTNDEQLRQKMSRDQKRKACILNDVSAYHNSLLENYRRLCKVD